eukprot:4943973-Prymnesium_polylepis.1
MSRRSAPGSRPVRTHRARRAGATVWCALCGWLISGALLCGWLISRAPCGVRVPEGPRGDSEAGGAACACADGCCAGVGCAGLCAGPPAIFLDEIPARMRLCKAVRRVL